LAVRTDPAVSWRRVLVVTYGGREISDEFQYYG
jgi:hypothetical protein